MYPVDVTIGIVNYNSGEYLKKCLDCIFNYTKDIEYEVVIVDNHSQDGSAQFLSNHNKISKCILNSKNVGYACACNQIISTSRGRYLLFLNPDVQFSSNVIGEMVHFMDAQPEAMASACKILFPDGSVQGSHGYFPEKRVVLLRSIAADKVLRLIPQVRRNFDFDYCKYSTKVTEVDWILGAFFLVRRDVCNRIGFFDNNYFLYGEEIDFCYRLRRVNCKILFNPEHEIIHFMGASTRQRALRSIYHFHKAMYMLHRKFWMSKMGTLENIIVVNGIFWKMILAYGRHVSGIKKINEIYAHRSN